MPNSEKARLNAIISECGQYRYTLHRDLSKDVSGARRALFIMLNPSKADAVKNDATINRCIYFAKREGCSALTVVNLFALRSTYPTDLRRCEDPVGPENDHHIAEQVQMHTGCLIVAAWGADSFAVTRASEVLSRFGPFHCFGMNQDGSPRHPGRISNAEALLPLK